MCECVCRCALAACPGMLRVWCAAGPRSSVPRARGGRGGVCVRARRDGPEQVVAAVALGGAGRWAGGPRGRAGGGGLGPAAGNSDMSGCCFASSARRWLAADPRRRRGRGAPGWEGPAAGGAGGGGGAGLRRRGAGRAWPAAAGRRPLLGRTGVRRGLPGRSLGRLRNFVLPRGRPGLSVCTCVSECERVSLSSFCCVAAFFGWAFGVWCLFWSGGVIAGLNVYAELGSVSSARRSVFCGPCVGRACVCLWFCVPLLTPSTDRRPSSLSRGLPRSRSWPCRWVRSNREMPVGSGRDPRQG